MTTRRLSFALALVLAAAVQWPVSAHVGSPDIFLEGQAGPYRLLVTIRPPYAIPGIADVEVLATSDDLRDVRIVPLPLTGELMSAGAWQVRVTVAGDRGEGMLSVPVPTLPQSTWR